MQIYQLRNDDGRVYAFEMESVYIQPRKIAALLSTVGGVSNIRVRKLFASPPDVHVRFRYGNREFIVWEPYADSNRYFIGPDEDNRVAHVDLSELERVFERYRPPLWVRMSGDLLSLKFLAAFGRKT